MLSSTPAGESSSPSLLSKSLRLITFFSLLETSCVFMCFLPLKMSKDFLTESWSDDNTVWFSSSKLCNNLHWRSISSIWFFSSKSLTSCSRLFFLVFIPSRLLLFSNNDLSMSAISLLSTDFLSSHNTKAVLILSFCFIKYWSSTFLTLYFSFNSMVALVIFLTSSTRHSYSLADFS